MYFAFPRADSSLCHRYCSSSHTLSSSTNGSFLGYVTGYKPTAYDDLYWVTFANGMDRHEIEFVLPRDYHHQFCVGDQVGVDDLMSFQPKLTPTTFSHCICGMTLDPRCDNCRSNQKTWLRTKTLTATNRFEIYKGAATVETVRDVGSWTKNREEEMLTENSFELF